MCKKTITIMILIMLGLTSTVHASAEDLKKWSERGVYNEQYENYKEYKYMNAEYVFSVEEYDIFSEQDFKYANRIGNYYAEGIFDDIDENGNYVFTEDDLKYEKRVAEAYVYQYYNIEYKKGKKYIEQGGVFETRYWMYAGVQAAANDELNRRNKEKEAAANDEELPAGLQPTGQSESVNDINNQIDEIIKPFEGKALIDFQDVLDVYPSQSMVSEKLNKAKELLKKTKDSTRINRLSEFITAAEGAIASFNYGNSSGTITSGTPIMSTFSGTGIADPTDETTVDTYKPDYLTDAEAGSLLTMAGTILGIIRNIGVAIGVIGLSVIGLRYMFASVTEKAEYKETMMPYMLGCILLMAGTTIISFIYSVAVEFGR